MVPWWEQESRSQEPIPGRQNSSTCSPVPSDHFQNINPKGRIIKNVKDSDHGALTPNTGPPEHGALGDCSAQTPIRLAQPGTSCCQGPLWPIFIL